MKLPLYLAAAACALAVDASAQQRTQGKNPTPANPTPAKSSAQKGATGAANPDGKPVVNHPFVGPNDNCASATAISGGGPFAFDNTGANTDGPPACGNFQADVWYNWTAGASGTFEVSLCGGATFDTEVAVYDTAACVGTQLACDDDFCGLVSKTSFTAVSGNVYKIRIGGYAGNSGTGTFTVLQPPPPPPPSPDDCSIAGALSGPGPYGFNNLSATTGTQGQNESICNFYGLTGIDNDVWFTWTATSSGSATLTLCGTANGMDSKVAVYAGSGCPSASAIVCDDDSTCGLESTVTWCVTSGQTFTIQLGNYPGALPNTGTFSIVVVPPGSGNDECQGATALAATGPYPFSNVGATTGCTGQGNSVCNFYNTTSITNDIWFTWTANGSGMASLTLCGTAGGMDSRVAIYAGAGCPTNPAIACDDDSACGLESTVCWPVTSGQSYTIQLGNFPGASPGSGTFDITIGSASPCQYDDGTDENSFGFIAGGDLVWTQSFGSAGGGSTTVSSVEVAWGSAAFPGGAPPNGSPVRVAIWDDPNDDGDPSDAVLLQVVNTTVANVDTDVLNVIPFTPVSVNGVFFVGASEEHNSGQYPAPMDTSSCIVGGHQWLWGNYGTTTPADLANPMNNLQQPVTADSQGLSCNLLLRGGCNLSPLSPFCLPGQNGVHACPCNNPPAGNGLGCNNFGAGPADSATLSGSGSASLSADSLVFTSTGENNTSFTIFAQGTTTIPSGLVFGAGIRCVGGQLKRLYNGNAVGGTIVRPSGSDPSVHVRSAALGYTITAGTTLYYFAYYRDPGASGPCGSSTATFNATQAGSVLWSN